MSRVYSDFYPDRGVWVFWRKGHVDLEAFQRNLRADLGMRFALKSPARHALYRNTPFAKRQPGGPDHFLTECEAGPGAFPVTLVEMTDLAQEAA